MFVILSNVLELFFAHRAIEGLNGFRHLGLNIRSASDVVLSRRQQQSQLPIYDDEPLSTRWSPPSLRKRSETSSLR